MSVHFNFWASDDGWWQAYDGDYSPALSPGDPDCCYYDIDYIRVVPEPSRLFLFVSGVAGLIVIARGRIKP